MKRVWPLVLLLGLIVAVLWRPRPVAAPLPEPPAAALPDPKEALDFTADVPPPPPAPSATADAEPPTEPEPEFKPDPCLKALIWLLHTQNEDGSWGDVLLSFQGHVIDKPGVTGLALVAIMGASYSHLSRDTYEGKCVGDAVKKGLLWLLKDQREDGGFRSARDVPLEQAIAGLAVSEAYGLTGSPLFKEPAEKAIDALTRLQSKGCWGTPVQNAWATTALWSARSSEIPVRGETLDGLRRFYATSGRNEPGAALFLIGIDLKRKDPSVAAAVDRIAARPPDPDLADLHAWHQESIILFHYDGPSGERWTAWKEPLKNALRGSQAPTGQWHGGTRSHTVVRTCLGALTYEIFYRHKYSIFTAGR